MPVWALSYKESSGDEMKKKQPAPGRYHRKGVTLRELFRRFPDDKLGFQVWAIATYLLTTSLKGHFPA